MSYSRKHPQLAPQPTPRLLGDRIAELTARMGIPQCAPCKKRQAALNKLHGWFRRTPR